MECGVEVLCKEGFVERDWVFSGLRILEAIGTMFVDATVLQCSDDSPCIQMADRNC